MKSHQNQDYNQVCRNTLLHFESVYRFGCNFSASSSFRLLQTKQFNFTTTNNVFIGSSFSILTIHNCYNRLCQEKYCDLSTATRLIACQSHWPNNWSARHSQQFKREKQGWYRTTSFRKLRQNTWHGAFNLLQLKISMHILLTVLYTFTRVLTRRICLTIKGFFSWWSFPVFSWLWCVIQGRYCTEKLAACRSLSSGLEEKQW